MRHPLLLLLFSITYCCGELQNDPESIFTRLREMGVIAGEVERVQWSPDDAFSDDIQELADPVVLVGTAVAQWPAVRRWTPEYIASRIGDLPGVSASAKRVFTYFHDDYPLAEWHQDGAQSASTKVNLTAEEFFREAQLGGEGDRDRYVYYGRPVEVTPALLEDIDADFLLTANRASSKDAKVQLWLGDRGVATHLHYDEPDNFYAQIYGSKRFLLVPPASLEDIYLFPYLHPAHQSSQVDLEAPDLDRFPRFAHVRALEVTLRAGEVLHLPSLWGHFVVSCEASAAINAWSPSGPAEAVRLTRGLPLPVPARAVGPERALLHRLQLAHLLDAVFGPGGAKALTRMVFETRYQPIQGRDSVVANSRGRSHCLAVLSDMSEDVYDEVWDDWDEEAEWAPVSWAELADEHADRWEAYAAEVVPAYDFARRVDGSDSRIRMWAADFAEVVALTIVHEAQDVAPFLAEMASGC